MMIMAYLFIFKENKKLKEIHLIKKVCNVYLKQNSGEKKDLYYTFLLIMSKSREKNTVIKINLKIYSLKKVSGFRLSQD